MPAELRSTLCSEDDRFAYFLKDNTLRKDPDRRALVRIVLGRYPQWSDRQVATVCGCDHKTVAPIRAAMIDGGEIPHQETRTGRDGVAQPAHKPPRRPTLREDKPKLKPVPEEQHDVAADAAPAAAPAPMTERQCQMAEAAKRRLVVGLSQIGGLIQGLTEIDPRRLQAACSREELEGWGATASEHARSLLAFGATLDAGGGHGLTDAGS